MFIAFDVKKGVKYAKLCHSKWENGKSIKTYIYLGRVIDKKKGIYFNRKTGYCSFDEKQNEIVSLPDFIPDDIKEKANATSATGIKNQEELILQFGPEYFLDAYIENIGLKKCIEQLGYRNNDRLLTMLLFYLIEDKPNSYAENWYSRSYCRKMYPKANIESQRISDMFASIGAEEKQRSFFKCYFEWLRNDIGEAEFANILIDSTGLPNNVHFPLTAINNHNGVISKEVRLIYVVHKTTGMPIYFRYCPGNIIDAKTITNTVEELKCYNFNIDHAILDAGYYTRENVDTLFRHKINFITRLQSNRKLYKEIIKNNIIGLDSKENFVRYGARYLYIKCVNCNLDGVNDTYNGFAYLVKDINRAHDEEKREMLRGVADEIEVDKIYDNIQNKGIFMLISPKKYDVKDILPIYYTRQQIEQVFDIAKNNVSILPLRTHNEQTFRGHLILTFIATSIFRKLQGLMSNYKMSPEKALYSLESQMCKVYGDTILPLEANKNTNDIFKLANINFPDKITLSHG